MSNIRKGMENVKQEIEDSGFTLISETPTHRLEKFEVLCSEGHITKIHMKDIRRGRRCGGPCRYKSFKLDDLTVKTRLLANGYMLTHNNTNYTNSTQKMEVCCENGHVWKAKCDNLVNDFRHCPSCCDKGFNPHKPGMFYYLKISTEEGSLYKVGITNRSVRERFPVNSDYNKITVLRELHFDSGQQAWDLEKYYLSTFSAFRYKGPPVLTSGNTELFSRDIFSLDSN